MIHKTLVLVLLLIPFTSIGQPSEESPIKFAFYSPSWGSSSDLNLLAGLRLVVDNQTSTPIRLDAIEFQSDMENIAALTIPIELDIPAGSPAERELPYSDLLSLNQCVSNALQGNWRLVEISNYTLNPSVRRLIIQDTSAFRIYQCVATVRTRVTNTLNDESLVREEWVLYHFESKPQG